MKCSNLFVQNGLMKGTGKKTLSFFNLQTTYWSWAINAFLPQNLKSHGLRQTKVSILKLSIR